jgi:anti-anti-sigma regulatory factor
MVTAIFWGLFGVMGVYDIAVGISPSTAPNFISTGMNFVFSIYFS